MADSDSRYDLLIIGGGISGLGIARAAAARGLRCAVLEKGSCCRAASDNSLRIIHGGLRYLQQLNLSRVRESLLEQERLLAAHPGLVTPLWCMMPLKRFGFKSKIPLFCALHAYQALAACVGAERVRRARLISNGCVREKGALLGDATPYGALLWRDAVMPSARAFGDAIRNAAVAEGVSIREHTRAESVRRSGREFEVQAVIDGTRQSFGTAVVVNAAGAWIQRFEHDCGFGALRWCKAFNVVIARRAVGDYAEGGTGRAGRVFFAVPREEGTAIGTFYHMYSGDPDEVRADEWELDQAVRDVNEALPALALRREEIVSVEAAVLPARCNTAAGPKLYGSERIVSKDGYIEVLSTKYTTFQSQAREVMRHVERYVPIPRKDAGALP